MASAGRTGTRRSSSADQRSSTVVAVEQLHHEERGAVLGDVVVHDAHRARVLHRVRGVALAEEARADVLARAQLRVEHLHGELGLVAVGRRVDGGHAADAEDAVEAVLAHDDGPHPVMDEGLQIFRLLRHGRRDAPP